ncbi:MAG: class II aldolase/adducin family protein [Candidatus Gastranaerophilales bacterium]|nr:class II aldolase/adducin family protein [Candidatus Gastranaerophilales bacterium]
MDFTEEKNAIIEIGKKLYFKNLTSGTSGNISMRLGDGFLVTATGTALGDLSMEDVVFVDINGQPLIEGKNPSSESFLHLAIYKKRPDLNAIVHCHAPYVCTFAVAHKDLDMPIMAENVLYFGKIPIAEYAMPSSKELVDNTAKLFARYDAVLMANHGIICGDKTLRHAFYKTETAETYAQVAVFSKLLGEPKLLDEKALKDLQILKKQLTH